MSASKSSSAASTKTANLTDSQNVTSTVSRVFDNVGNNSVYFNTDPAPSVASQPDNKVLLLTVGLAIGGVLLLNRKT